MPRDLSVVVFGATGITGRGVAAHLAGRAGEVGFKWAAAGRDPEKVGRVLGELGVEPPETIAADVEDADSLAAMASRARVVLDLVGPYTLYGEPVIEAYIGAGSHYADLTGEIPFVRQMIDAAHDRAVEAGVKIVNVSGFEALPADLCVALAAQTGRERWSEELAQADLNVEMITPGGALKPSEAISGGTLQSIAEIVGHEAARTISDPAALIVEPDLAERVRKVSPIAIGPRIGSQGEVIGPMAPAAFINPAVIHRTAALAAAEEGREFNPFRYREGVAIPGGAATLPLRYAVAGALSGSQAAVRAISKASPPIRGRASDLLRRRLPGSGFGPPGRPHGGVLLEDGGRRTHRRRALRPGRPRRRRPPRVPGDREADRRGRPAAIGGRRHPEAQRPAHPGDGARHRATRPLPPRRPPLPGLLLRPGPVAPVGVGRLRSGRGRRAGRFAERLGPVGPLPGEVLVVTAEWP